MADIDFFDVSRPGLDQEKCDGIARKLLNSDVSPFWWQGGHTYSVHSGDEIIQFRADTEPFNQDIVNLAKQIHGQVVPAIQLVELLPEAEASIWRMTKLPGVMYIQLPARGQITPAIQEQTVRDLAKFFASAWSNPQRQDTDWAAETESKLSLLEAHLPERFRPYATRARQSLPRIANLPWALTHNDLSDGNILIDPLTGSLTGVVDWGRAFICPFGRALWGVESVLMSLTSDGCNFIFSDHARVRRIFAQVFVDSLPEELSAATLETVEDSRLLGLLLRYGFDWSTEGRLEVTVEKLCKGGPCNGCEILDTLLFTQMFDSRTPSTLESGTTGDAI